MHFSTESNTAFGYRMSILNGYGRYSAIETWDLHVFLRSMLKSAQHIQETMFSFYKLAQFYHSSDFCFFFHVLVPFLIQGEKVWPEIYVSIS